MSIKSAVFAELEAHRGSELSGQSLATKLGVSRNAVWKAINTLRDDGYEIEAGTNKGYKLLKVSDRLSAEEIKGLLRTKNVCVEVYTELDSTNLEAKRKLAQGLSGNTLILAESQTDGRGRLGRSFYSPSSTGLYMSAVIHPHAGFSDAVSITTATAVAVVRAIEKLTDIKPMIKWVNDIYVGDKKVCGILTEAVTDFETATVASVIVGIGINITTSFFPEYVADRAASLGSEILRNRLAAEIFDNLIELTDKLSFDSFIEEYREHSLVLGKPVEFTRNGISQVGVATEINNRGGLVVALPDDTSTVLDSGEISLRVR